MKRTSFDNPQVELPGKKFNMLWLGVSSLVLLKAIPATRHILPEPINIMNHIGNIGISTSLGMAVGFGTGLFVESRSYANDTVETKRSMRSKMAAAGFAAGLVVNSLVETRWGVNLIHWDNTLDPLDLVYGTAAATATAAFAPRISEPYQIEYQPKHLQSPS